MSKANVLVSGKGDVPLFFVVPPFAPFKIRVKFKCKDVPFVPRILRGGVGGDSCEATSYPDMLFLFDNSWLVNNEITKSVF